MMQPGANRPDINRPAPTVPASGGLGAIHQRYYAVLNSNMLAIDPALQAFLQLDVPRLLAVTNAAALWINANNAESSRQASEQLVATVRGLQSA